MWFKIFPEIITIQGNNENTGYFPWTIENKPGKIFPNETHIETWKTTADEFEEKQELNNSKRKFRYWNREQKEIESKLSSGNPTKMNFERCPNVLPNWLDWLTKSQPVGSELSEILEDFFWKDE